MAGNVWEWVNDAYSYDYYSHSPYSNPTGPSSGIIKVFRGGSWDTKQFEVQVTHRDYYDPTYAYFDDLGFRCAISQAP
jgi:formylglycine-generating enzyme required for sulfatase activity